MSPHMMLCFACNREFQYGPTIYNGKVIKRYEINACLECLGNNWDGWSPDIEKRLIKHLKEKGIPVPERNQHGWLPTE